MTALLGDVARMTLARVRSLEAQLQGEPFLNDTDWLLLPLEKQELVLRRLSALRAYEKLDKPTAKDALSLGTASGVGIARFYQLLSHWKENNRSPLSLASLGRAERRSRLPAENTAAAIRDAISDCLASDPLMPTGEIIKQLRKSWSGPGELPTDTAIRVFHDRALRSMERAPGSFTYRLGGRSDKQGITANGFGETLVIDHATIADLLDEGTALAPTVTLAIDLWSGATLGATAVAGTAKPDGVIAALKDAARRLAEGGAGSGTAAAPARPRIVLAAGSSPEWRNLVAGLIHAGFDVVHREDNVPRLGDAARLILGLQIGRLRLERRAPRPPAHLDYRGKAVQPRDVIDRILREEVDAVLDRRVPKEAWRDAPAFHVPSFEIGAASDEEPSLSSTKPDGTRDPRGPEGVKFLLYWMADRAVGDAGTVEVEQSADSVWRVNATIADPARRDALFAQLAEGAMEVTSVHRVPVIVNVDVKGAS